MKWAVHKNYSDYKNAHRQSLKLRSQGWFTKILSGPPYGIRLLKRKPPITVVKNGRTYIQMYNGMFKRVKNDIRRT